MNSLYFSLGALGIGACAYAYLAWQRAKHSRAFDRAVADGKNYMRKLQQLGQEYDADERTDILTSHQLFVANQHRHELETENRRLEGHIDNLRALLADIHAQGVNSASGTAKAMAAKAAAGMAK